MQKTRMFWLLECCEMLIVRLLKNEEILIKNEIKHNIECYCVENWNSVSYDIYCTLMPAECWQIYRFHRTIDVRF